MTTWTISILMGAFNEKDHSTRNRFEHRILLYKLEEGISPERLKETIYLENREAPYRVETGEAIYWKVVRILDIYEPMDKVEFDNGAEVYSRFFTDEDLALPEIIKRYFSDLDWEQSLIEKENTDG